jgi:YHS domain-containing protein
MKPVLAFTAAATLLIAASACGPAPASSRSAAAQKPVRIETVASTPHVPAQLEAPPMLQDEAPTPKPKALPWETPTPIVFSPEDEKLRAELPFTPAIAMDPVDGGKISIRAATPTYEYKGKIYYFSSEANRKSFMANPPQYLKGGMMRL